MQPTLFPNHDLEKPINVASVPQRSPFRYPGGKTWLVPRVRQWLLSSQKPVHFYEPFAGGGIISLTVACEHLANHVTMVELDDQVAAVWQTIFNDKGGAEWLAQAILNFNITNQTVQETLSAVPLDNRQKAFQTILKNRTYRGGILAKGSAPFNKGENGKGIKSRWYPETLAKRLRAIINVREQITFIEGDGMAFIEQHIHDTDICWFIDPPYTASKKKAGSRLYTHSILDHNRLFALMAESAGDFLMTYDNAEEIIELAGKHNFTTRLIAMKNTHNEEMTELLIGRNLDWME